ncbi:hypothetical protein BH09BAC3_BH09BAC3_25840 [soil metagenome]
MKNSIIVIFLSIVFGFSNVSQHMQNGIWSWDNYFTKQVHRLFDFQSNPDLQKQHQTSGKASS